MIRVNAPVRIPTRLLLWRIAVAVAMLFAVVVGSTSALAAGGFGRPVPGRHIYDRSGIFTAAEVAALETHAAAVQRAGAPVVVYVQTQSADYNATEADARDLMAAWNVESRPRVKDGLVIFINLIPGNLRHGEVSLYAGAKHAQGGHLPQYELARIYQSVMLPLLAHGQTAAGIAAGLDAVAHSLIHGPAPPPQPGPLQRAAAGFARVPMTVLAALIAAAVLLLTLRAWRARPVTSAAVVRTVTPPSDLPPAFVGALVAGRVGDAQVEATILELARRGALTIEPAGHKKAQARLLDQHVVRDALEASVWESLSAQAGPDGVVASNRLSKVRSRWGSSKSVLRRELQTRRWYDESAGIRRRPLYQSGTAALVLATAGLIVAAIGQEPLGLIGPALLLAAGIVALSAGYALADTTVEGLRVAAPWRGYLAGLKASGKDPALAPDLDEALPYAVAMGAATTLDRRLKSASAAGYVPAWLGSRHAGAWSESGFYPYWVAFHSSVSPSSSDGGAGAGAAAGGAGAGGAF